MKEFEDTPYMTLERVDGSFIEFYRCITDPSCFRTEFVGRPVANWSEYFENEMASGNVKK